MTDRKPILCMDFDGVIHSYKSGWMGAQLIPDGPVPGAFDFMIEAVKHFRVAIFSSRTNEIGGLEAMRDWMAYNASLHFTSAQPAADFLNALEWPIAKPAAFVTIDDRAVTFTGEWPAMETLLAFKPWNKK